MAEFNILDHLDKLESDGGKNDPRGDHSYKCPACGADNFKVNHRSGKYQGFNCECTNRQIRDAIEPPRKPGGDIQQKAIRPVQTRHWDYFTEATLARDAIALTVRRTDDGKGKRKIWQQSRIDGFEPAEIGEKVLPYGIQEAREALENGERWIFHVEGEPCVDALRGIGLTAITSLGGSGNFRSERDGGHIPADRLCILPDQDDGGIKYAEEIAAAYPGASWCFPFPNSPRWNGKRPKSKGLDVADWIAIGATAEQIISGIGGKDQEPVERQAEPVTDQLRKDDLKALASAAERIYCDKEIPPQERLVHLRHVARELDITLRDTELQRYIWDVRRKLAGAIEGYNPDDIIETPDQKWLLDGLLLAGDANLVVGLPKANKTTFVLSALGAIYNGDRQFLGKDLAEDLPPLFIAGTDQPGHIWQQFLQRSGLADAAGRRSPHIIKMFTRERPIHLTPEGIDVMVQAAEEHPGMIFFLDSYSTLTRPLQLEENSPSFADPFIDFCEAVAPYGATPIFIHHAGKGGQGKSATFSSRGTTALPAAASQLVDVARLNADDDRDKRRIIKTEGRLAEPIKILATFNGDDGWTHHGDAEQVELAKQLDEAEDKLNDRQFSALELMRDRWAQSLEISQADLDGLKEFKGTDRNNRRRILDQLTRKGLATSREISTDKGRLKLFKPVEAEMSHSETTSGVSIRPDSSALPDSSLTTKGMSHINQLNHSSGTPQSPDPGDSTPNTGNPVVSAESSAMDLPDWITAPQDPQVLPW